MRRNRILVVLIGFALLTAIMIAPVAATTWTVCSAGCDFTGIDAATEKNGALEDGDTVFVHSGDYSDTDVESILKSITLKGEGADVVTYNMGGGHLEIHGTGTVVEGLKIVNSDRGMEVKPSATNCIFRNCIFEGLTQTTYGIQLFAVNTTFENNVVTGSAAAYGALYIENEGKIIVNNTIIDNPVPAMYIYNAPNSIFRRNNFSNNSDIMVYDPGEGIKWYLNNFIDTSIGNPYSGPLPAVTYWNSTEQIEYVCPSDGTYTNYLGNYWSDYTTKYPGASEEGCGIWDTTYEVPDSLGNDYRPLMAGFENYLGEPAGEDKPDLNVTAITTPANIYATESNSINATIKNNGTGDAGAFNVSLSADGTVVDRTGVAGLAGGASTEVSLEWTPSASGTYELCVVADCDGVIDESDETNNVTCMNVEVVEKSAAAVFDTGHGTYPSIRGTHTGTFTPNQTMVVNRMYTYPCVGTGGHTESVRFYGPGEVEVTKTWNGYHGDYHGIEFGADAPTLQAGTAYNYTIVTGSYPQIIHNETLTTPDGTINCTEFVDANEKRYTDWIPAIMLESGT